MSASLRVLLAALAALAATLALAVARASPPPPKPADAPASEFSAGRALETLRDLVGDGVPHPVGSPANARVRERVLARLAALGYQPEVHEAFTCNGAGTCATVRNVLTRLPGREQGPAVLLACHYDSVGAGPGASDDGVGVAVTLEVARILKSEPPRRNPVVFLVDDGEEAGLLGAETFLGHPWAKGVGAAVNLEARGSSGASLMFETSRDNAWLVRILASALERPVTTSVFPTIYERLPNDTDLTVFTAAGLPGVNFAFIGDVAHYHTPLDGTERVHPGTVQHHGDNALATVRALADDDLAHPPKGDAVFFDTFSLFVVAWPRSGTAPLAAAAGLLLAAGLARQRRRGALSAGRLAWGFLAFVLAIGGAASAGWLLLQGWRSCGAVPSGWIAHPAAALASVWLLAFAVATAAAVSLGRRATPLGLWAGAWTLWAAAAVGLAFAAPGLAYLFLVPAAVAGLAALFGSHWAAVLVPALVAGALWFPLDAFLYDAMGSALFPALAALVAFVAATVGPLAAAVEGRSRWAGPLGLAAAGLAAAAVAAIQPPYSEARPERVTIAHHDDGEVARWLVFPESGTLPQAMRGAAAFGAERVAALPWQPGSRAFSAPAPRGTAPPPSLEILESVRDGGSRRLRVRLLAPEGSTASLWLPSGAAVGGVRIGGRDLPPRRRARGRARGPTAFAIVAMPPEGVELELSLGGAAPIDAYLVARSPGLPEDGGALRGARPEIAAPSGAGDTAIVSRRIQL